MKVEIARDAFFDRRYMKIFVILALAAMIQAQQQTQQQPRVIEISVTYLTPWKINDKVTIECPRMDSTTGLPVTKLDKNNLTVLDYGPAPTCLETNEPMYLLYGVDAMSTCAWAVGMRAGSFIIKYVIIRRDLFQVSKGSSLWTCIYALTHLLTTRPFHSNLDCLPSHSST